MRMEARDFVILKHDFFGRLNSIWLTFVIKLIKLNVKKKLDKFVFTKLYIRK